jgi:signal transduction histidine kinase
LSAYLATWIEHSHIPADLQIQNERRLPLEIGKTLFRVALDALSNVARHSRASAAAVRQAFGAGQVTLSIADSGGGFGL